jgi:hypothetical protein
MTNFEYNLLLPLWPIGKNVIVFICTEELQDFYKIWEFLTVFRKHWHHQRFEFCPYTILNMYLQITLLIYVKFFQVVQFLSFFDVSWLRFFRAFSSVVRQIQECNSQRRGTDRTLPN